MERSRSFETITTGKISDMNRERHQGRKRKKKTKFTNERNDIIIFKCHIAKSKWKEQTTVRIKKQYENNKGKQFLQKC